MVDGSLLALMLFTFSKTLNHRLGVRMNSCQVSMSALMSGKNYAAG